MDGLQDRSPVRSETFGAHGHRTARDSRGRSAPAWNLQHEVQPHDRGLRQRVQCVLSAQTVKAQTPPGLRTRRNSAKTRSRSAKCCAPKFEITPSKLASANGNAHASAISKGTVGLSRRARANIFGENRSLWPALLSQPRAARHIPAQSRHRG